jgi:hypothetical protein
MQTNHSKIKYRQESSKIASITEAWYFLRGIVDEKTMQLTEFRFLFPWDLFQWLFLEQLQKDHPEEWRKHHPGA